ncbi:actin organization and endocytosis protein, partial [Coemansia spiralis]
MRNQARLPALSFVAASDLATYVQSFQSGAGGGPRIGGDAARKVLMQSRLPVAELGRIWELSDRRKQGSLSLPEFVLAMFLAQSRIRGKVLPDALPSSIAAEIDAAMAPLMAVGTQMAMAPQMAVAPQMAMAPQRAMTPQMAMAPPVPVSLPARGASQPVRSGSGGADLDMSFESRFPDIGGSAGALRNARQSFHQSMLEPRVPAQQQQEQQKWAISTQERAQYEAIFRQCDAGRTGVLKGGPAREVFAQSSLPQHELAKIWGLADTNNQGELNLDEFSVAMHLVFRRLAGAPIPDRLPAELVPRSTRGFMDSLSDMKGQLMLKDVRNSVSRASTPMHDVSLRLQPVGATDKDDDGYVYRSAHRHRNNRDRSASSTGQDSAEPVTPVAEPVSASGQSLDELRAEVRRRRDTVNQLKADTDKRSKEQAEGRVTARWKLDDLKREIEDIHRTTPAAAAADDGGDGDSEIARLVERRTTLVTSIDVLLQEIPRLAADYKRLADDLVEANKEALDKKKSKGTGGAGGSGEDVESRAARLVAQRMAALTGQTMDSLDEPDSGETERIDRQHRERMERMESVTNGLARVQQAVHELNVAGPAADPKWDQGAGLQSEEVRELVHRLQRIPPAARPPRSAPERGPVRTAAPPGSQPPPKTLPPQPQAAPSLAQRLAAATSPQERERLLKEIAEERFRERQRALGIPDPADEPQPEPPAAPAHVPSPPPLPKADEAPLQPPAATATATAAATAKPEMSQRGDDADLLGLSAGGDDAPANNPFGAPQPMPPAPRGYADIFNQLLEVDDYSDSSSDNEWDRDDSSDDEASPAAAVAKGASTSSRSPLEVAAALAAVVIDDKDDAASSDSSISFNTAFAQPTAAAAAAAAAATSEGETNPFLGLLSLDTGKA